MDKERVLGELKKEWEKLASLNGQEKMEYLWEYYRPALVVLLGIFFVLGCIFSAVLRAGEEVLLSAVVIDADREREEDFAKLGESLGEFLGTGKPGECVLVDTSATFSGQPEAEINVVMKLSVVEEHDIVVLGEALWERFREEDAFLDWEELLGTSYPQYASHIRDGALLVSESERWKKAGYVRYEPAYLCVLKSSPRKENAGRVAEYFFP